MACQVPPLISPVECSLDFPASRDMWNAGSAEEWRDAYLQHNTDLPVKPLTISQGINSVSRLRESQNIDMGFAAVLIVHSTWALAHGTSQLNLLTRPPSPTSNYQGPFSEKSHSADTVHLIEQTLMILGDCTSTLQPEVVLVSERILLGLHVSFEQVQLFAGKEGEEEARRTYPELQRWAESSDARKAVWHAGQILRAARRCNLKSLRDFRSVCLYHAGLTFWAYTIVLTASPPRSRNSTQMPRPTSRTNETTEVWLDGEDCQAVQRFISLDRGVVGVSDTDHGTFVPLTEPKALMSLCIDLLIKNANAVTNDECLPLVENLNQLMRDLGNAAQGLLSGQLRRSKDKSARHGAD
jgi:hypothetical protein